MLNKALVIGFLRLLTGVAQFAIILFVTRVFSLSDVGQYSLFVIFVGYFSLLAGLSFYTHVMREMATRPSKEWPYLLVQQWWFVCISLVSFVTFAFLILRAGWLDFQHASYFFIIFPLVVVNLLHENFLVGSGHPIFASLGLFLRSFWIFPVALFNALNPGLLDISFVYSSWLLAEGLTVFLTLGLFYQLELLPRQLRVDWSWIIIGVKVGFRYTCLGLLLLLTVSVQRVVLGQTHGNEVVGVFHFFFVISVFLPNLLEATLFSVLLPKIIAKQQSNGGDSLHWPDPRIFGLLVGGGGVGLVIIWMLTPFLFNFLGKPELYEFKQVFYFTATYALLYSTSRIFHYQFYAAGRDKLLLKINLIACTGACFVALLLVPRTGLAGATWSLLIAGVILVFSFGFPFLRRKGV